MARFRFLLSGPSASKFPLITGNRLPGIIGMILHKHLGFCFIRICRWMGKVILVREQLPLACLSLLLLKPTEDFSFERLTLFIECFWNSHPNQARCGRNVCLPSAKNRGVALSQQEAIARLHRHHWILRSWNAIEGQDRLGSSIDYIIENCTIAS